MANQLQQQFQKKFHPNCIEASEAILLTTVSPMALQEEVQPGAHPPDPLPPHRAPEEDPEGGKEGGGGRDPPAQGQWVVG